MGVRFVRIAPEERRKLEDFLHTWAHQDELFGGRYVRVVPLSNDQENQEHPPGENESRES